MKKLWGNRKPREKTIRKQIMRSMIIIVLIYFVLTRIYTVIKDMTYKEIFDTDVKEVLELVEELLEDSDNDDNPAAQRLKSEEFMEGIIKDVVIAAVTVEVVSVFTLVLVIVLSILYSKRASTRIVRPIEQLEVQMKAVGEGHFGITVKVDDAPKEIEGLAGCFNAMTDSLRNYIKKLTETNSEKEKLITELTNMRQIQANMLPSRYPTLNNVMLHADASAEV